MSDAKGQQNEPSMEEILASIRRIIAEDGDAPTADAAAPAAAPAAAAPQSAPAASAPSEPDDILELTDVVEPDGTVVNINAAKAPEPQRPAPPPPEPQQYVEFEPEAAQDRIVSPHTAAAAVGAFSQIAALRGGDMRGRDIGLGAGHLTLEAIVREELRPILRDWLDANLPNMVERLVQQEIARLVSDVQRR